MQDLTISTTIAEYLIRKKIEKELDKAHTQGIEQGMQQGRVEGAAQMLISTVRNVMSKTGKNQQEVMDMMCLPLEQCAMIVHLI